MSIEPRKVWQVIRYIDNIHGGEAAAAKQAETTDKKYGKTIPSDPDEEEHLHHQVEEEEEHPEEDVDFEDDEDSYNHLIEEEDEEDIISYDSESSSPSRQLMESPTAFQRPPMVLDLATNGNSNSGHHDHQVGLLQVPPRLVYVKLGGDSSENHVIKVNRPMAEDLSRMLSSNAAAAAALVSSAGGLVATLPEQFNITSSTSSSNSQKSSTTGTNDEELTSLTWLQDKNLIHGKCGWCPQQTIARWLSAARHFG